MKCLAVYLHAPLITKLKMEKAQAPKFNFEWINKGRIFKMMESCKNHLILRNKEYENKYEVLDAEDAIINNNNVVYNISMGIGLQDAKKQNYAMINEIKLLKENIEDTKVNKSEIAESCKIEMMTAQSLQAHVETLENDHTKFTHEADVKMQESKKEKYKLHVKAFHASKEIETNKKEIKRFKSHLEFAKKKATRI